MKLHPVYGHQDLVGGLLDAIRAERLPQALLLAGPPGVGKQRLALWIAQTLLCEDQVERPCGRCRSCGQAERLSHPDLHWFVPLVPRKRSGDAAKQIEETEVALAEVITERREQPVYGPPDGRASHAIAAVRLLQRRVALKPFQGSRKVVILGDAERLVVQEASQEAANALLKVLEEPPPKTTIVVTAASPQGLLPTVRSRLTLVPVRPIPDEDVRRFFIEQLGESEKAVSQRVARAAGRIGGGLGQGEDQTGAERAAEQLLIAVTKGPKAWAERSLAQPPWDARGGFTAMLDALARRLRRKAAAAAGKPGPDLARYVRALEAVERHRTDAQGNINPQAAVAVLAGELERLR